MKSTTDKCQMNKFQNLIPRIEKVIRQPQCYFITTQFKLVRYKEMLRVKILLQLIMQYIYISVNHYIFYIDCIFLANDCIFLIE